MRIRIPRFQLRVRHLPLLLLLLLGVTWPSDDAGRPAPPCGFIDDTVSPAVVVQCSRSNPLPSAPGTSLGSDSLGFGKQWFLSSFTNIASGENSGALFLDDISVVTLRRTTGSGNQLIVARSSDGGRTFPIQASTGFVINNTVGFARFNASAKRYIVTGGNCAVEVCISTSSALLSGWTRSTGWPLSTTVGQPTAIESQGNTVIAMGQQLISNQIHTCRSTDGGQTFANCVTFGSIGEVPGNGLTSPGPGIWLALSSTGRIFRSTDDGLSWASVVTLSGGGATRLSYFPMLCTSTSRCLANFLGLISVSNDAGLTWASLANVNGIGDAVSICNYGNGVVGALSDTGNTSPTAVLLTAANSIDNGSSFAFGSVTGSNWNGTGVPALGSFVCNKSGRGFATQSNNNNSALSYWYNPSGAGGVVLLGQNGSPLGIDSSGRLTANQGAPAFTPSTWPVAPTQLTGILNAAPTVSAANAAATVTLTGIASQRICIRAIAIKATGAAATFTLTIQTAAVVVLDFGTIGPIAVGAPSSLPAVPASGICGTTGSTMTVNIGAGGAGAVTNTNVIADQG